MPSYFDIYVISDKRSLDSVECFLDEFLPLREQSADEYDFPQYADTPEVTYREASQALEKCVAEQKAEYSFYWRALENRKPEHAMVFFLKDGNVIYGLSTDDAFPGYAEELLQKMRALLNTGLGYIGHEATPGAENLEEFKAQINAHKP